MSEPYQIFSFVVDGIEAARAVATADRILRAHGGALEEDSMLYLADVGVVDGAGALERLAAHATLGAIDYAMPEGMTNVSFHGEAGKVHAVAISILQRAFDHGGDESRRRYEDVAKQLHAGLGATRTVFDWGLRARGLRWEEELARLRKRQFDGGYDILDLR